MRFVQVLLALLLLTLAASRVSAEQRQFGNIIYTPLSGWYAGSDEGGKLNLLSDLPNDLCEFC
jgi:hypothetical protein